MINRIEKLILKELLEDAKAKPKEIAARINTSLNTVRDYIERLETRKIIDGYSIIIDPGAFNIKEVIQILVRFDFDDTESMIHFAESVSKDFLQQIPEVGFAATSERGLFLIIIPVSETRKNQIIQTIKDSARVREIKETKLAIVDKKAKRMFCYMDPLYKNLKKPKKVKDTN